MFSLCISMTACLHTVSYRSLLYVPLCGSSRPTVSFAGRVGVAAVCAGGFAGGAGCAVERPGPRQTTARSSRIALRDNSRMSVIGILT